jgi:hypothetical protein
MVATAASYSGPTAIVGDDMRAETGCHQRERARVHAAHAEGSER